MSNFSLSTLFKIPSLTQLASVSTFSNSLWSGIVRLSDLIQFKDIIDILVVAVLMYFVLVFIKQTRSYFILGTFGGIFLISAVARFLNLTLTRQILSPLITFFIVIFVIVFQREIRRFFKWFALSRGSLSKRAINITEEVTDSIVHAVMEMAKRRLGSIIVLSGEYPLDDVVEGGFPLDGQVSTPLILSIFDDTTPGHDGALLVENKRIKTFGLHLPLAEDFKDFSRFGTRHRAAIGITERTDCLAIVVSEERGVVSVVEAGNIRSVASGEQLSHIIKKFMGENPNEYKSTWEYFILNHFVLKIVSLVLATILWFLVGAQTVVITEDFSVPIEFKSVAPGLEIKKTTPSDATLTLSGDTRDISTLDPTRDVHLIIDMSSYATGTYSVDLSEDLVHYPSYINLGKVSPSRINVTVGTSDTVIK